MSAEADALFALRKSELVERLLEAHEENAMLRRKIDALRQQSPRPLSGGSRSAARTTNARHVDCSDPDSPHPHPPHHTQQQAQVQPQGPPVPPVRRRPSLIGPYGISLSVLLIERGAAVSVPLAALLDGGGRARPGAREADTPVVGSSWLRADESFARSASAGGAEEPFAIGRGTELLVPPRGARGGSAECGRPSITLDFAGDETREPSPKRPSAQQTARRRSLQNELRQLSLGRLVNRGSLSLDPDALVSHQTLRTFHQRVLDGWDALSPVSSYGNAVYHYIVKTFAVSNGCFHNPSDLEGFGRTLISLCGEVKSVLQSEPRHSSVLSPCYVFGDLHGNFWDLFYFLDNLISFQDLRYTPHRFLFLGDYVDRGDFSVEVVAYLFAMKVLAPDKVTLLRGNHEDTLVSGDVTGYGNSSFRSQCRDLFGSVLGEELWHRASETFAYLPLTANIDERIFCTHGGIPRYRGGVDDRLEVLCREDFPPLESFFQVPEDETPQQRMFRQIGMDTCWADPADDESALDKWGFGANPRGSGVILFGSKAVDDFLDRYGFEYIFRAHQEKSDGLKLSKSARVFTIFSTSSYVGHENGAGVVLVADKKIRLIIKNADGSHGNGDAEHDGDLEVNQ